MGCEVEDDIRADYSTLEPQLEPGISSIYAPISSLHFLSFGHFFRLIDTVRCSDYN
jgi:hypothetical protein